MIAIVQKKNEIEFIKCNSVEEVKGKILDLLTDEEYKEIQKEAAAANWI